MRLQIDLAIDSMGQADSPDITMACISSLKRRGILVLVGSMTCPLPNSHGELAYLPPDVFFYSDVVQQLYLAHIRMVGI